MNNFKNTKENMDFKTYFIINNKYYKCKLSDIYINIIVCLINITGIIYYKKSLISCNKGIAECAKIFDFDFNFKIFVNISISATTILFSFIQIYYKRSPTFHLLYLIPSYIYYFITDNGDTFESHGAINRMLLYLSIFIIFFIYLLFKSIYNNIRRLKLCKNIVIILILILVAISLYYKFLHKYKCEYFYQGYTGYNAQYNSKYDGCKMEELEECNIENFEGILDLNKILGYKCRHEQKEKHTFFKYIDKSNEITRAKRIGFPNANTIDHYSIEDIKSMAKQFLTKLVDIDKHPNYEHEFELIYDDKDEGHITINLTRNETLVKERKIIYNTKNRYISKNFLIVYLDSISRRKLKRLHPRIYNFIKKYMYNKDDKDNKKEFDSFEFLKFNNYESFTYPNNIPFFLGVSEYDYNKKGISLVKYFKEQGYITGLMVDSCSKDSWDYDFDNNITKKRRFILDDYDHNGNILFCDGNYFDLDYPYRKPNGVYGPLRSCLYDKDVYEYIFEYSNQFWEAYINEPKYLKIAFNYAHEVTGELSRVLDSVLIDFLESWIKKGYLQNTTIMFLSDHGNQVSVFFQLFSKDHILEQSLPFVFIFIPHTNNHIETNEYNTIKNNLLFNRDRFIVPVDIYATIVDFIYYNQHTNITNNLQGKSLFRKITEKRTCKNFTDYRINNYSKCKCH